MTVTTIPLFTPPPLFTLFLEVGGWWGCVLPIFLTLSRAFFQLLCYIYVIPVFISVTCSDVTPVGLENLLGFFKLHRYL